MDDYYSVEKFKVAYAGSIPSIPDKSMWSKATHGFFMHPPLLKSMLTLLSAPDLYIASARFRVAFPLEYSPKVYQSTEPKRQETIY